MISMLIYFPFVIAVKSDSRFQSLTQLIAEAKAKPNTINYSSAGVGSTQHLAGALFCAMAGIEMIHIPYRGGTGPITDLLGRAGGHPGRHPDRDACRISLPARSADSA